MEFIPEPQNAQIFGQDKKRDAKPNGKTQHNKQHNNKSTLGVRKMVRRGERTTIKGSGRKGDAIDIDAFSEDNGKKVEGRGFEGDYSIYIDMTEEDDEGEEEEDEDEDDRGVA